MSNSSLRVSFQFGYSEVGPDSVPSFPEASTLYAVLTSGRYVKWQYVGRASTQWAILRRASRVPFLA
jgi:hypothetical protein